MKQDSFASFHPAINFFWFMAVIFIGIFFPHPVMQVIAVVAATVYSFITLGKKSAAKFFGGMMLLLIFGTLFNPLFNHYGVTILGYFPNGNPITLESIVYGFVLTVTLVTSMLWFSSFTKVMTTDKFIYLFGRVIPSMSLILSMVFRFVPLFMNQIHKISNGQKCVGRDVSNGNVLERARHGIRIFSIMVTWALENAIDTADSMRARGYGLRGRTAFSIFRFDKRDAVLTAVCLAVLALLLTGLSMGCGFVQYDPKFKIAELTPMAIVTWASYAILCFVPVVVDLVDAWTWYKLRRTAPRGISMTGISPALADTMTREDVETLIVEGNDTWQLSV